MRVILLDCGLWCRDTECKLPTHNCLNCLLKKIRQDRNSLDKDIKIISRDVAEFENMTLDTILDSSIPEYPLKDVLEQKVEWFLQRTVAVPECEGDCDNCPECTAEYDPDIEPEIENE